MLAWTELKCMRVRDWPVSNMGTCTPNVSQVHNISSLIILAVESIICIIATSHA